MKRRPHARRAAWMVSQLAGSLAILLVILTTARAFIP